MNAERVFQYGDFSAAFDVTDYVAVERYEAQVEIYNREMEKSKEKKPESAILKHQVLTIAEFFDGMFGDDAANKILGDTTSGYQAAQAFSAFQVFVSKQSEATSQFYAAISNRYSPANREQRRAAEKAKQKQ